MVKIGGLDKDEQEKRRGLCGPSILRVLGSPKQ